MKLIDIAKTAIILIISIVGATIATIQYINQTIDGKISAAFDEHKVENRLVNLENEDKPLSSYSITVSVFTDKSVLQEGLRNEFLVAEEPKKNSYVFQNINLPSEISKKHLVGAFWSPSASLDQVPLFHRINVRVDEQNRLQMVALRRQGAPSGILEARVHVLYREGE